MLFSREKNFTTRRPSSLTRHCWIRVSPIVQYSPLLPPVGVWAVSQSQCGWSSSQISYRSSALVGLYPTNYLIWHRPLPRRKKKCCPFKLWASSCFGLVYIKYTSPRTSSSDLKIINISQLFLENLKIFLQYTENQISSVMEKNLRLYQEQLNSLSLLRLMRY